MRPPPALLAVAGLALLLAACASGDPAPAPAHHDAARPVTIEAADGLRLDARHFPAAGERIAILLHMYADDQRSWFAFAALLAERGTDALTLDFRGYGASEGEQNPAAAADDVRAALAWARAAGFTRIALIGASMGGTAALAAAADAPVDAVAALSAPAAMSDLDAASAIGSVAAPITLIAAADDLSGAESLRDLAARAALADGDVLMVEGRAHGTELLEGPAGDAVRSWLLGFLDGVWGR